MLLPAGEPGRSFRVTIFTRDQRVSEISRISRRGNRSVLPRRTTLNSSPTSQTWSNFMDQNTKKDPNPSQTPERARRPATGIWASNTPNQPRRMNTPNRMIQSGVQSHFQKSVDAEEILCDSSPARGATVDTGQAGSGWKVLTAASQANGFSRWIE